MWNRSNSFIRPPRSIWRCKDPNLICAILLDLLFFLYYGLGGYWRQHLSARNMLDFHRTIHFSRYLVSESWMCGPQESHKKQNWTIPKQASQSQRNSYLQMPSIVLQCVAMNIDLTLEDAFRSVLQCVAVRCSALQCVAVLCSVE